MSIPEIVGKTLIEASIYEVEPEGRELLLRFDDSTQVSIEVGRSFAVDISYSKDDMPDQPMLHREIH